jgi:hypothetical protein
MMDEHENRLQAGLESLEAGKEFADLQQDSPEKDAVLLALAERLRMAQWPERDAQQVQAQKKQVLIAYDKEQKMKSETRQPTSWLKDWRLPALFSAGALALVLCAR